MQISRKAVAAATLTAPTLLVLAVVPGAANAHGTMNNPPSRTMVCFTENPESPKSAACKQAVALGGTQPLYDWNEVNLANAAGRHREIIPDGKLCSAGRDKYRGFDQARADWPTTTMASGAAFTFRYRATAPHKGGFDLYVTKDGYDPAKPLKWSDLESRPFLSTQNPTLADGAYVMQGRLPVKQGRHLIYAIWQRSDSPEAFYSCSDVVFGGGSGTPAGGPSAQPTATTQPPANQPTTKPTTQPTAQPTASAPPSQQPSAITLSAINAGAGVTPASTRVGQQVTVTAVCGGSRVRGVASNAFNPRRLFAQAPAAAWAPSLRAVRAGTHPVIVYCQNGNQARTTLTVR
ncbi:lytic polysaccharide monooxygenase auxiliary activity family 9 protein [Nonomuraea rhizosphaerae]|uniref:lytic polysaccharide monooxygenase auxiliary activity family 9 protein n=1 Tax=Nonomuraea rhizosphaerae TaxID=2665663 RepID=UPI001C5D36D1|nr:lytic polysaccharide monooxygenase [Nonomuraea rhizosphaerae]